MTMPNIVEIARYTMLMMIKFFTNLSMVPPQDTVMISAFIIKQNEQGVYDESHTSAVMLMPALTS